MTPRILSSKKWTPFPKEFATQIETVVRETFAKELSKAQIIVEGRIYQEEILLRVGFLEAGRLAQINFETSMQYSSDKDNAIATIHLCVDAIGSLMQDYFESDRELELPYTWKPISFQKQTIFVQFSTVNTSLEAEADRLLGTFNDQLVQEAETEAATETESTSLGSDHEEHSDCDHDHNHNHDHEHDHEHEHEHDHDEDLDLEQDLKDSQKIKIH